MAFILAKSPCMENSIHPVSSLTRWLLLFALYTGLYSFKVTDTMVFYFTMVLYFTMCCQKEIRIAEIF